MYDLWFNVLLVIFDLGMLSIFWRRPGARVALGTFVGLLGLTVGTAACIQGGLFLHLRLLAWALFVHTPALLLGGALRLRRTCPGLAASGVGGALLLIAVGVDAFLIEPRWLEVTRYQLASHRLSRPYKLVVLADIQADRVDDYLRYVLERAMQEQPDLVILPGDYLQVEHDQLPELRCQFRSLLREVGFMAGMGIFAVEGNVEHNTPWEHLWAAFPAATFSSSGTLDLGELAVTGLTLRDSFDPELELEPRDDFHIVVGHGPDFALARFEADLLLAGHTHGGQVRLPLVGPLLTLSRIPRAWAAGRTELPDGRVLIVSRGIGMERAHAPRLRFLCRPELVVVELLPAI